MVEYSCVGRVELSRVVMVEYSGDGKVESSRVVMSIVVFVELS